MFDEISWMATGEKDFASQLKISWDTQLVKHSRLIVILCGSVSSWIDENNYYCIDKNRMFTFIHKKEFIPNSSDQWVTAVGETYKVKIT